MDEIKLKFDDLTEDVKDGIWFEVSKIVKQELKEKLSKEDFQKITFHEFDCAIHKKIKESKFIFQ